MATKTFSGRAEEGKLAYADALAQRDHDMSYGQYCATVLLDQIQLSHALPQLPQPDGELEKRLQALHRMRKMSDRLRGSRLASMSDDELKELVASRYE